MSSSPSIATKWVVRLLAGGLDRKTRSTGAYVDDCHSRPQPVSKKIHLLFEPAFLFEQDVGRDGLQTCRNRERYGIRKLELDCVQFNSIKLILTHSQARLHTNATTWSETQLPFCTRRHPRRTWWTLPCAGAKRDAGRPSVLNCRRARRRSRHTPLLNSQSNPSGQFW